MMNSSISGRPDRTANTDHPSTPGLAQTSAAFLSVAVSLATLPALGFAGSPADSAAMDSADSKLLSGYYEVEYETLRDGGHRVRHYLVSGGERIEVRAGEGETGALAGSEIQARVLSGEADPVIMAPPETRLADAAATNVANSNTGSGMAPLPGTLGEQRTLVLMTNFQENPDDQPLTEAEARELIFGQVSDFFYESSYGQTWLAGDVYGWFTLPLSREVCDLNAAGEAADQAAMAAGVDLAAYSRIVYLHTDTACGIYGSATLGGNPSRARIDGVFSADNIAHEMGHNFGLYHSRALDCAGETLAATCQSIEYGDSYDVMGNPEFGHFNAFQKARLGWLGAGESPAVTTVSTDGTYVIDNLETSGDNPRALRVPGAIDPVSGRQSWFYLEYRQSIGFDNFLAKRSYRLYRGDVTHGVVVHRAMESDPQSGTLLHMNLDTPFRDIYGYTDWLDPALPVGAEFQDPESGVTLRAEWADGNSAGVRVSFAGEACLPIAPLITLQAGDHVGTAGTELSYTVEIANRDPAACGSSTFQFADSVPAGWSGELSPQSMTLAPGDLGTLSLAVTSATAATPGDYPITLRITNTAETAHDSSTEFQYTVTAGQAADDQAPTIPGGLVASVSKRRISLDWNPSSDNVAVQGYRIFRNGSEIAATVDTRYTDASAASGVEYTYSVTAYDPAGNESPPSAGVRTAISQGGGKGGGKGKNGR